MDMEIDLSNIGTVNTMFAALFSKLGVPIKTTISANVHEEALNGTVTIKQLPIGTSVSGKVRASHNCTENIVSIDEEQSESGIVDRVTSPSQSKFKEDSEKTDNNTSAGMYFLHFLVYRMDSTINAEINFFKPASYIIEALCAKSYEDTTPNLKDFEAQILGKKNLAPI